MMLGRGFWKRAALPLVKLATQANVTWYVINANL